MAYRKGSRSRRTSSRRSASSTYRKPGVRRTNRRSGNRGRAGGRGGQTIKLVIQHDVPSGTNPFSMETPQKATTTKKARL